MELKIIPARTSELYGTVTGISRNVDKMMFMQDGRPVAAGLQQIIEMLSEFASQEELEEIAGFLAGAYQFTRGTAVIGNLHLVQDGASLDVSNIYSRAPFTVEVETATAALQYLSAASELNAGHGPPEMSDGGDRWVLRNNRPYRIPANLLGSKQEGDVPIVAMFHHKMYEALLTA